MVNSREVGEPGKARLLLIGQTCSLRRWLVVIIPGIFNADIPPYFFWIRSHIHMEKRRFTEQPLLFKRFGVCLNPLNLLIASELKHPFSCLTASPFPQPLSQHLPHTK